MNNLEEELNLYSKIDAEFKNIITDSFNGLVITGQGNSGHDFHAYIPNENKHFEKTDYYYNGNRSFLHFTSIPNLMSILNSRAFRLYNLVNSNDPAEYKHAGDVLRISEHEIANRKKYLFTLSFCSIDELSNKKVWEEYGGNFTGVAIAFQIENDPRDWIKYHLSPVSYDDTSKFNNYLKKLRNLKQNSISTPVAI